MERDMELIRSILFQVEGRVLPAMSELMEEGASAEETERYGHHVRILIGAGYLQGIDAASSEGPDWLELELTWPGHEFLDTLRDPTVWDRTKKVARASGGASFQILIEVGKAIIVDTAKGLLKGH